MTLHDTSAFIIAENDEQIVEKPENKL